MQAKIQTKLINHEKLTLQEINQMGEDGLNGNAIAIFNTALYYLLEKRDAHAFDILLDEFHAVAKKKDLITANHALAYLRIEETEKVLA